MDRVVELLQQKLTTKFEGVSEKILKDFALAKSKKVTEEGEIDKLVEGVNIQTLIDFNADKRVTEGVEAFKKKWESTQQTKDPQEKPEQPNQAVEDVPKWAEVLVKQIEQVGNRLGALEGAKIKDIRQSQLTEVIKDLPINLQKPYNRINIDNLKDEEFTNLVNEIKTEVSSIQKDLGSNGIVFKQPKIGLNDVPKTASDEEIKGVVSKIRF